jgi:hypothetical protein
MIAKRGFRYEEVDGRPKGLPFCPKCLLEAIQIRPAKVLHAFHCRNCKSFYTNLTEFR